MPESLRTAGKALLRFLTTLAVRSRAAAVASAAWLRPRLVELRAGCVAFVAWLKPRLLELRDACAQNAARFVAWLRPRLAELRAALQRGIERLPGLIEAGRRTSAELLHRLAGGIAPAEVEPEAEPAPLSSDTEFMAMLGDLGAEPAAPAHGADTTLKDAELAALRAEMHNLRDLGDRLAHTEQERLALATRLAELEAAGDPRLEQKLERREGVLERTREQLAKQRQKTAEWKRKAAERWHEIRALRSRVKALEQAGAQGQAAEPPGPLPRRTSGARRASRSGRRA